MSRWSEYRAKVGRLNVVEAEADERGAELRAAAIEKLGPVRGRVAWHMGAAGGEEDARYHDINGRAQAVLDEMSPVGRVMAYTAPWLGTSPEGEGQ